MADNILLDINDKIRDFASRNNKTTNPVDVNRKQSGTKSKKTKSTNKKTNNKNKGK